MFNVINGVNLNKIYTPADTSVAEWIRADAGTGASIESGNHKCPKIWADLNKVHINKKIVTTFKEVVVGKKFKELFKLKSIRLFVYER